MANTDSGVMGKARHSHPVTQWPHVRSLRKAPMILYHVRYRLASAYLAQRGDHKRDMQIVSWKEREWNVTKWSRSRAWRLLIGNSNCTKRKWKQWQWWRSHQRYACLKAACQIFAIGEEKDYDTKDLLHACSHKLSMNILLFCLFPFVLLFRICYHFDMRFTFHDSFS